VVIYYSCFLEWRALNMDKDIVKNTLSFHGQQFSKHWESERGPGELEKLGASEVDYSVDYTSLCFASFSISAHFKIQQD
jgi:hypothetical protein